MQTHEISQNWSEIKGKCDLYETAQFEGVHVKIIHFSQFFKGCVLIEHPTKGKMWVIFSELTNFVL